MLELLSSRIAVVCFSNAVNLSHARQLVKEKRNPAQVIIPRGVIRFPFIAAFTLEKVSSLEILTQLDANLSRAR